MNSPENQPATLPNYPNAETDAPAGLSNDEKIKRRRGWRWAIAASVLGVISSAGIQNAELISDGVKLFDDNHEVPVPEGCDVPNPEFVAPEIGGGADGNEVAAFDPVLLEVSGNVSAARTVPFSGSGNFEGRDFHLGYFDTHIADYFQPESGITLSVFSDDSDGFKISDHELMESVSVNVQNYGIYAHQAVRKLVECLYQDIFVDRKLWGQTIPLYIPSNPDTCMNGIFMVRLAEGQTATDCHTRGFTMPSSRIRFGPFSHDVKGYVVATGGNNDPRIAEAQISRIISHEMIHQYLRMLNVEQRLDPEERAVDYIVISAWQEGLYEEITPIDYANK